jgi:hypothetical protein
MKENKTEEFQCVTREVPAAGAQYPGENPATAEESCWFGGSCPIYFPDYYADLYEREPPDPALKISYTLRREDVYACMQHEHRWRSNQPRNVVATLLLAVAFALYTGHFLIFFDRGSFIMALVCVVMTVTIWMFPNYLFREYASRRAEESLRVRFEKDRVVVGQGDGAWDIPMDQSCTYCEYSGLMVLHLVNKNLFVIPIRAIEPSRVEDVRAMLKAGTRPHELKVFFK